MRKVANRQIIRMLSFRTMKEKRWKNLISVLAIALTALLFTAVFTVGSSLISSLEESTMRQVGTSAHGGYKTLSVEEYEQVKKAGGYQKISYDIFAGFAMNPELGEIQTEVRYAEDQMAKWYFSYPEKGKMPEEYQECVASSKVLEALGVPMEIGAKVPLSILTHTASGEEKLIEEEFVLSGYFEANESSHAQELWISRKWLEANVDILHQNMDEKTKQTGRWDPDGSIQAAIMFSSSIDIESQMEEMTRRAGLAENAVKESVNWAYATSSIDGTSVALFAGLLFIIILSGYLIIYNIFYINVTTDIRYYGLLKTIGTTGRQLRRMVRQQAFLLSAAGIPLGLFAGWFVGKAVLPAIYITMDFGGVENVELNLWIFAGSALFALLVVYLSCIKPCRLATRVSPIEAVRYVENNGYKKKEKKSSKVSMPGLAIANLGRNKKKAVLVITSLSLSLILLNATYCLIKGFSFDEYVEDYLVGDMQVSHFCTVNMSYPVRDYEAITPELAAELADIDGVEQIAIPYNRTGIATLKGPVLESYGEYYEQVLQETDRYYMDEVVAQVMESGQVYSATYYLAEEMFPMLEFEEGSFDEEKFKQGGYAILLDAAESKNWLHVGDRIILGSYTEGEESLPSKELEIMTVAEMPYALGSKSYPACGVCLLVSEKDFFELYEVRGGLHACLTVEEEKEAQVMQTVEALLKQNYPELTLVTKESLRETFSDFTGMFGMVGGLLGAVLGIIGILNLVNAMITSILSRKQEFAMMQAVGMTGKQLEQMLTMEGIWYGILTLLISGTVGNVISYGLVYLMGKNMNYFVWDFHILPLALSIPVIALVSVALPVICYHALCKKSIIERLRLAEV